MYKARFKKWGLVKNNKINEVRSILHEKHERDKAGKPSTFTRGGREVDMERLHRYIKRKGVDLSEMTSDPSASYALPQGVTCRTPSPEPSDATSSSSYHDPRFYTQPGSYTQHCVNGEGKGRA